jgi:hypothetical protein
LKSLKRDARAEHFSDARWADFARNVGSEEGRGEVQAHLDAGCQPCRAMANRLYAVARMAANERKLVIRREWVERAKEIAGTAPAAWGWIENLNAIVAHLIHSSSLDWQPAGVRSVGGDPGLAASRMIFRAADYAIYLKVEPLLGGEAAEIIGEIANERDHEESMEGIPIQMVARGVTLSESTTNRFGEFLIEYPIRKNATLRFALKDRGQRIDLPLGSGLEK